MKAVFYDLDNTLYSQMDDVRQRIAHCAELFGMSHEVVDYWVREWSVDGPKKRILDQLAEKFELNAQKSDIIKEYRGFKTKISLSDDARHIIEYCNKNNLLQFLITNGREEVQMQKIRSLRAEGLFTKFAVSVGEYSKPSPFWFKKFMGEYGLAPGDCISVGDRYDIDGNASEAAGIPFIYLSGGPIREKVPENIKRINNIYELKEYL